MKNGPLPTCRRRASHRSMLSPPMMHGVVRRHLFVVSYLRLAGRPAADGEVCEPEDVCALHHARRFCFLFTGRK